MPSRFLLPALAALCMGAAQAADTGGDAATPSAAERVAAARKALDAKDYTRAIRELSAAVREEPNNADAHNLLGYSWRKRSNPDVTRAFEHYYIALRINPKHKGAHEYIGQAYLMEKRVSQAEQHLAELEKICGGPSCPEYQELSKAIMEFKAKP